MSNNSKEVTIQVHVQICVDKSYELLCGNDCPWKLFQRGWIDTWDCYLFDTRLEKKPGSEKILRCRECLKKKALKKPFA